MGILKPYFISSVLCFLCLGASIAAKIDNANPWFSGSLLSFGAENPSQGKFFIQPYLYVTRLPGSYDKNSKFCSDRNTHQYQGILELEIGITKNVACELEVAQIHSYSKTQGTVNNGQIDLYLAFQIFKDKRHTWIPDLRMIVGELVPYGRFSHPNSSLTETIVSSAGASSTALILIYRKIFYGKHPSNILLNVNYLIPRSFSVKGMTRLGGDENTRGIYKPGKEWEIDFVYEYKFNRTWGYVMDIFYQYQDQAGFHATKNPFAAPPSTSSSSNLSLAPALEYNFNSDLAFVIGAWFSVIGRNSAAFNSLVSTISYMF